MASSHNRGIRDGPGGEQTDRLSQAQGAADDARAELDEMAGKSRHDMSFLPDVNVAGFSAQKWAQLGSAAAGGDAKARNIVRQVMTLGLAVMITIVMLIVTGEFVAQTDSTGAFNGTIDTVVENVRTAFGIIAVLFLLVPIGAVVYYVRGFGMGGMGR
jgi:ABC-type microcin C transport system permease subunit YejE